MSNFLLALFLLWLPADTPDKAPDPELVQTALVELKAAFSSRKSEDQIAVIQKHHLLMDVQVAQAIAKGLNDRDPGVQMATIEALRWMPFPSTLKVLHRSLQRDKRIRKNDELFVALLRAVGQHADPSSIKLIEDGAFSSATDANAKARIYSLGRIRHDDSLSALMELLQRTAGLITRGRGKATLQKHFDVALEVLTGETFKGDPQLWLQWWRKNKKTFKVSPDQPPLTPKARTSWGKYWSKPRVRREREAQGKGRKGRKEASVRERSAL